MKPDSGLRHRDSETFDAKFASKQIHARGHEFYHPNVSKTVPLKIIDPKLWQLWTRFPYAWELPRVCLAMNPAATNTYLDLQNTWRLPDNSAVLSQPQTWGDDKTEFVDWGKRIINRLENSMSGEFKSNDWDKLKIQVGEFILTFFNFDRAKPVMTWETCPSLAVVLVMQSCLPALGIEFETFDHWVKEYRDKDIGRAMHNQFTRKPTTDRARHFRSEAIKYNFSKITEKDIHNYCLEWYAARVLKGNVTWAWMAIDEYLGNHPEDSYLQRYNGEHPTRETLERHIRIIDGLKI